jgi:hypothetical protein
MTKMPLYLPCAILPYLKCVGYARQVHLQPLIFFLFYSLSLCYIQSVNRPYGFQHLLPATVIESKEVGAATCPLVDLARLSNVARPTAVRVRWRVFRTCSSTPRQARDR